MNNALLTYKDKNYYIRAELLEAMKAYHRDSFIFNTEQLNLKRNDFYDSYSTNGYVNAQIIYNEFIKIDSSLQKEDSYKTDIMLELMKTLLGNRYKAFYNIYKKQYRVKSISKKAYLHRAKLDIEIVLNKYNMKTAIEKWGEREKDDVIDSIEILMNYYCSIGEYELANRLLETAIEKPNTLKKPKTFTTLTKGWLNFHTPIMVKKCNIAKKEAIKLLKEVIKTIKPNF